ncbi:MAG: hypothetical protein WC969_06795 [Elusimicrobiota bacterium]|jgi:hypothetical protein
MLTLCLPPGPGVRLAGMGYVDLDAYRDGLAVSGWTPAVPTREVPGISGLRQVRYRPNLNLNAEGELSGLAETTLRVGVENETLGFFSEFQSLPAKDGKGLNARRDDGWLSRAFVMQSEDGMTTEIVLVRTSKAAGRGWAFKTAADGILRQTLLVGLGADKKAHGMSVASTPESESLFNAEKRFWLEQVGPPSSAGASLGAFQRLARAALSVGGVFPQLPAQRQLLGLSDLPCRVLRTDQDEKHFSFFIVTETSDPDIIITDMILEGGTLFLTGVDGRLRKALSTDYKTRNQFLDLTPEVQAAFKTAKARWVEQADDLFGTPRPR